MAKLTRRNTIIGLGALVGGTGALAASGAFTSVEAERDVDINTAGDSTALLEIAIEGDYDGVSDGGGDTIQIDFSSINLDATTTFESALRITPTGDDTDGNWSIDVKDDSDSSIIGSGSPLRLEYNDSDSTVSSSDVTDVGSDEDVYFDIKLDLTDITDTSSGDDALDTQLGEPPEVTIEAAR